MSLYPAIPIMSPIAEIDVSRLFSDRLITVYSDLVAGFSRETGSGIRAYCWMLNHVHLS
jgi:hypothetical protein